MYIWANDFKYNAEISAGDRTELMDDAKKETEDYGVGFFARGSLDYKVDSWIFRL